jgi:hypothetical protein
MQAKETDKEKIAEIEMMNQMMTVREIKVVELKKENEELKKKLS